MAKRYISRIPDKIQAWKCLTSERICQYSPGPIPPHARDDACGDPKRTPITIASEPRRSKV